MGYLSVGGSPRLSWKHGQSIECCCWKTTSTPYCFYRADTMLRSVICCGLVFGPIVGHKMAKHKMTETTPCDGRCISRVPHKPHIFYTIH